MKKLSVSILLLSLMIQCFPMSSTSARIAQPIVTPSTQQAQKVSPTSFREPSIQPIRLESQIHDSARKGDKFEVTIRTTVNVDVNVDKPIVMKSSLSRLSDDTNYIIPVRKSDTIYQGKFSYQKVTEVIEILSQLDPGQYQLVYSAQTEPSKSITYAGSKSFYFTIMSDGVVKGWKVKPATKIKLNSETRNGYTCVKPQKTRNPRYVPPTVQPSSNNSTHVTLTGSWKYLDRDFATERSVQFAEVEVWYVDCYGIWMRVAITSTNFQGQFTATYPKIDDAIAWEVKYTLNNDRVRVENVDEIVFSIEQYYQDLSNGGNIGVNKLSTLSAPLVATWLYDDTIKTYNFLSAFKKPTMKATTIFDFYGEKAQFNLKKEKMLIDFDDAQSKFLLPHEIGHLNMYDLYNKYTPYFECEGEDRIHFMSGKTEPGCAWNEGWAHFIAMVVNDSPYFVYQSGLTINVEDTTHYQVGGDSVEGRVAGALWDLFDKADDGLDTRDYRFEQIYYAMYSKINNNFSEFWSQWKALKYKSEAKYSLHQNQIMYDPDEMLYPGETKYIRGESQKVYAIKGDGHTYNIVTGWHLEESDTFLALYEDLDLSYNLMSNNNYQGSIYARINDQELQAGKMYYLEVRSIVPTIPVFAEVHLSLARSHKDLSKPVDFELLKDNTPVVIQGETEKLFQITGYEGIPIIETADYTVNASDGKPVRQHSNTYLELYADPERKTRIAYDDDSAGNELSRISQVKLDAGKMYYVRVTNREVGKPFYTQLTYKAIRPITVLTPNYIKSGYFFNNAYLEGEPEKIFKIIGEENMAYFFTGYFMNLSDTYMELYADSGLTQLLTSNDNRGGDYNAQFQYPLKSGKTYYLRVLHSKDKKNPGQPTTPVYARVYMVYPN